tara:strand:- start:67 stop:291 length:225 start_codon:yes stop_codon:yes gene_type:complete
LQIRKISIGADYKGSAMHYILGQSVLNGNYEIHLIEFSSEKESFLIYIEKDNELYLWKEFNKNIPVSIEYNIHF